MEGPYSFPFFQFPCPFMDDLENGLVGISQQNHNDLALHSNRVSDDVGAANMMINGDGDGDGVGLVYKKRRCEEGPRKKKDRHSKICTAQGLRDRRMRLSVKVAREFFDLQDMLDFDKASKTIEWLLINSQPAIQQLHLHHNKSMSSSSEVVSETNYTKEIESLSKPRKRARPPIAKESRDKARARARDRTSDKIKLKTSKQPTNKDSPFCSILACGANEFNEARMEPAYAMASKKPSLGNDPNAQEHSSIFMTISNGGPWNPSSFFWTSPNAQDPIPNSIFMNTNALEFGVPSPLLTASNSSNIGGTHFL